MGGLGLRKEQLTQLAAAIGIKSMAGAKRNDAALDTTTKQRHVADDIQELMTSRLVGIIQLGKVAQFACI